MSLRDIFAAITQERAAVPVHVRSSFENFRSYVHEHTPEGHTFEVSRQWRRERAVCAIHGRSVPHAGRCPKCAGYVEPIGAA